ncbi:MAG: hypothetical protein JO019_02685, partial [Candidatus Kaiserbacteria bacterium]|nr:hypothetical protein [Candidatus Kaiserbacteria bacterium]
MKRVVIKVGSGIVYGRSGHFAATRFRAIASQIEWLTKNRVEPILVVSGAVALGARMCEVHDEDSRRYAAALGTSTLTRGVDAALRIRKLRAAHFLIAADSEAELHRPDLIVKG